MFISKNYRGYRGGAWAKETLLVLICITFFLKTRLLGGFQHLDFSNTLKIFLQQAIARMLFWGQQGVTPNILKAVRHYERGAVQWEDPVSMYDYGIVLLQVRFVFDMQYGTTLTNILI